MENQHVKHSNPQVLILDVQEEISSFGLEGKMNDYIGVQKSVLNILEQEKFFTEVINEESGMIIEITKKSIKETLGNGKRFQNLTRGLKELKIATLRSLPKLIRIAHLKQYEVPNFHGNAARYAYFIVEAQINALDVSIRIDVKKTSAKNKFWLHMIDLNEKKPNYSVLVN